MALGVVALVILALVFLGPALAMMVADVLFRPGR